MRPVLIITHLEDRHPGLAREALERAGCRVVQTNLADDPMPAYDLSEVSGIVSLGGEQSATAVDGDPFLTAEVKLLSAALQAGTPVLGMCLGAQLLAVAAGGQVTRAPRMIIGWPELRPLAPSRDDPLFGPLPSGLPVLKWHEDVIIAPHGAVALGTTDDLGETVFRVGESAWGSQAHFEATPSLMIDQWLAKDGGVAQVEEAGYEIDAYRAYSRRQLEAQMAAAHPLFERFGRLTRNGARG